MSDAIIASVLGSIIFVAGLVYCTRDRAIPYEDTAYPGRKEDELKERIKSMQEDIKKIYNIIKK